MSDAENNNTNPFVLRDILEKIDDLRAAVVSALKVHEPAKPALQPHEHGIGKVNFTPNTPPENVRREYLYWAEFLRGGDAGILQPGVEYTCLFGEEYKQEGSGIHGLPETVDVRFGFPRPFLFHRLVIEEGSEHVDVIYIAVGMETLWGPDKHVPGTRFVPEATGVDFKRPIATGTLVTATVVNKSPEPQRFRAKVVGEEPVDPNAKLDAKVVE